MISGRFESYWNRTKTYEALRRYIDMDMDGLHDKVVRLVSGEQVPVNTGTYANDMTTFHAADDVLTLLVHLGYLGYDAAAGEAFVLNREVLGEFANSIARCDWRSSRPSTAGGPSARHRRARALRTWCSSRSPRPRMPRVS